MGKRSDSGLTGARGLTSFIALSVWEIAHRWHNLDPNATDPKNLPFPVQDTLRSLCLGLVQQAIPACDIGGHDFGIVSTGPKYDVWHASASADERVLGYEAAVNKHTQLHQEAVAGLLRCVDQRVYDRQKLDSVYISIFGLVRFCEMNYLPKPEFWFPGESKEVVTPPRREQIDKQVCQGIARTLWDEHPDLTIQTLIKHPAIQRNGNGAQYKEKTLRGWLSEVDPRSAEAKTGRPPKPKPG